MKRIGMVIAAALLVGCQDQTMTGIDRSAGIARKDIVVQNSASENARYAIDDVMARIVPTLSDAGAAQGLVAAMLGLQQAVDAGRAADAPGLAKVASVQLERYSSAATADPAEVDAMRLALTMLLGS
jgi:hypothetical protein